MTQHLEHPDITHALRTGYPRSHFTLFAEYNRECCLCGAMGKLDDDGHCEDCRPVECAMCGEETHADETSNGICEGCLGKAANDQETALEYARSRDADRVGDVQFIAEAVAWEIFKKQAEKNGENVYRDYSFFIAEMAGVLQDKLLGGNWDIPMFRTVSERAIGRGIAVGLEEFCLDDKYAFAEWLAITYVKPNDSTALNGMFGDIKEDLAKISIRKGVAV